MTARGASARRKGHDFERACAIYLGTVTTRSVRPGTHVDGGDLILPGWCAELRAREKWRVESWFDDVTGKVVAGEHPLLVLNRDGMNIADSLAVMRLSEFRSRAMKEEAT